MNVKEKDLVHKALGLAESVGSKVASGYWLADGSTPGPLPTISNSYIDIVGGNGIYIALKDYESTSYYRTTDGASSWTNYSFPAHIYHRDLQIVYGQGVFVGKQSGDNAVYYSTDGIKWTAGTIPAEIPEYNETLFYGLNAFWVFGGVNNTDRNKTIRSTDGGKTWQTVGCSGLYNSNSAGEDSFSFDPDTNTFVSGCANECVYVSKDGINWDQLDCSDYGFGTLCAGGGYAIMGVSGSYTSSYGLQYFNLETGEAKWIGNRDYFGSFIKYLGDGEFYFIGSQVTSKTRNLYKFDTSTLSVSVVTSFTSTDSDKGFFLGSMDDKLIAYVDGNTYYAYTPNLWAADFDASIVDNNGVDKTGYVINAITGVIQTNTLDAAYTAGVNAYKGE